jgi:hypothetical protein
VLRQRAEERIGRRIVEREDGQRLPAVGLDGDPRRPAAEASAGVVQEDGTLEYHAIQTSREKAMPAAALRAPSATSTPVRSRGLP